MKKLAEKLFGTPADRSISDSVFVPNVGVLLGPFEGPQSVVHCFCENCGTHFEFPQASLKTVARSHNMSLPSDLSSHYLHVGACSVCRGKEGKISLRQIPHAA